MHSMPTSHCREPVVNNSQEVGCARRSIPNLIPRKFIDKSWSLIRRSLIRRSPIDSQIEKRSSLGWDTQILGWDRGIPGLVGLLGLVTQMGLDTRAGLLGSATGS